VVSLSPPAVTTLEERERLAMPVLGADERCVRIAVHDNGVGMSDTVREHMFEPFFTTKDIGEGTGLGLSVAHGIVTEHRGWFEIDSTPEIGTKISVCLPLGL
jgi:signal transduction histidine kinase